MNESEDERFARLNAQYVAAQAKVDQDEAELADRLVTEAGIDPKVVAALIPLRADSDADVIYRIMFNYSLAVAEAIALPRIPWAKIPTGAIEALIAELAELDADNVLVTKARRALGRRMMKP
jgi:hypothetical protein